MSNIVISLDDDKYRFIAERRGHKTAMDQPEKDGGNNTAMTPVEVFLSSLGGCAAYFAKVFCERHQIPTKDMKIEMKWEWVENPHRIGKIEMKLDIPKGIDEKLKKGILRAAMECPVKNTIAGNPEITLTI